MLCKSKVGCGVVVVVLVVIIVVVITIIRTDSSDSIASNILVWISYISKTSFFCRIRIYHHVYT